MYSNPVSKSENGLHLTTCTADAASNITRARFMAHVESDPRVKAGLVVAKECGGFAADTFVKATFEVRWTVGGKHYAVKKIATEAEATAIAADRWSKVVARLEAHAAKRAA